MGRFRFLDGAGAASQGGPRRQLCRGRFHPRGRRAEHHLRRAHAFPATPDSSGRFARFNSRPDGRRSVARAQKPGAEGQGTGQETGRGREVEKTGLTTDERGLTLINFLTQRRKGSDTNCTNYYQFKYAEGVKDISPGLKRSDYPG